MRIFTTLKEEIIPRIFVLSESQAFDLLLEAASLGDVYTKYYSQIPEEEFREIVAADPTSGDDKMGKYSKWLLALYTNEELKLEDLYKATEYLATFHKYKNKLEKKDIGQYKSLGELYQAIEPYADNTQAASHKEELRQIKKGAKKVYEDDEWLVIVPETKEAAIEYGKGTQWCTAATGSTNYFDYYNEKGPLYINIDKKTGQKLQFHFNSQQFMDETDTRFKRDRYNFTEGLYNFYRQQYGNDALLLRYDYVGYESDGLTYVQVNVVGDPDMGQNHKCNFIDENGNPISDEWFDDANYFDDNGLAIVYRGYKQNYLRQDGTLVLDKWCNKVNKFSGGFGIISDNNLRNYVDINGNILCDIWFDIAKIFNEGAAVVGLLHDGGLIYNAINTNGEYLFDKWFKKTGMCFHDGALQVSLDDDKITYIKKDGEFLTDMTFDVASRFFYGCAIVKKDKLYNAINKNGELLFDQWYYDITYFGKGSGDEFDVFDSFFRLNNQQGLTLADRNGDIICDNWYDTIDNFKGGCAIVKKQGLWNVIGLDGKEICNEWLSYIYRDGDFLICHNREGKRNLLSPYGGFALEKWHDFIRLDRSYTGNYRTYELLGYDNDASDGGPTEVIHNAEKFKFILRKTNEAKQRKTITITESQYKELLTESQESKSISAAKKLAMDKMGWDEARADKFVRKELRDAFSVLHHNSKAGKFILGLTRMFLDRQLTDGGIIQQLNNTIELVASDAHINEYDRNLNGMSAQELIDRFAGARKEMGDKDREEVGALELQENNDYTIVPIDNFEQSSQYGKYTSWCVTHNDYMLDSYTSGGIGQFYFCLKNGFENVPEERGEGCPLDEYGLSMVAVSVDGDGNLNTCTCRWNHSCGGDDHIMDTKQISQLIGRNFYEVFKPNNKWKNAVENAMQRLNNGENPGDIFSDFMVSEVDKKYYYYVGLFNQWNIVVKEENTGEFKLISPNLWFDNIYDIRDTIFPVEKNSKWNYLKEDGTLLSPNQWFDWVEKGHNDGFSRVTLNNQVNIINVTNGNLLSPDLWFDSFLGFLNGLAIVILNREQNLIDTNGNLKLKEWVDNIFYNNKYDENDNIIFISKNGEGFNFVTTDNFEIQSDIWFDSIEEFKDGLAMVEKNRQYNFVNKNGNLLSSRWFDDTSYFREGFARININEKENYIDKNGNYLTNQWFCYCASFKNGFGRVKREDRKMNFIDQNGNLLCDQWFEQAYPFANGFAMVQNGETPNGEAWNYVKQNGELLCRKWYTNVYNFCPEGIAFVKMNGLQNMINTNGEEILNKWVEEIERVQDNFFAILYNGKFNFINSEGKLLFGDWFDSYKLNINYSNNTRPIKVTKDYKMNYIIDGKLLSNLWFDNIELYYGGSFSRVTLNGKYNYLKPDGTLLSPNQWFDSASVFSSYDGTACVYINKIRYILNSNGELREYPYIKYETKQRKTITITESQYKELIAESQESKSISAAKKLVIQKFGWDEARADEFVRKELRDTLPTLHTRNGGKFILGVTRMFCDNQLNTGAIIMQLNDTLGLVASDAHINEYDRNLNGMSAQELIDRFAAAMKDISDKDREEVSALELQENNKYTIVQIDDFEQSRQYGQYTSWCVTHDPDMLAHYTSDGIGQFYFCLKNGFENVPKERGEGCPLDEYGLSMVAVSVNEKGNLNTCTCRWNHDNGGDDHIMDTKQISQLIGKNFYEVFKPNNKWQIAVENAMQRLANGENPNRIFSSIRRVKSKNKKFLKVQLTSKYNLIDEDNQLLFDAWFNNIETDGKSDLIIAIDSMKFSLFDENGGILCNGEKFDYIWRDYNSGTVFIEKENSTTFLRQDKTINDVWFDSVQSFFDGYAVVTTNGFQNLVGIDGELVSEEWYKHVDSLSNTHRTYTIVYDREGNANMMDLNGNILLPVWYAEIKNYFDDWGHAVAGKYNEFRHGIEYNLIDETGEPISEMWFDSIGKTTTDFLANYFRYDENGILPVEKQGKYNFLKRDGELLCKDMWFNYVDYFNNGFAVVTRDNGTSNFLRPDGTFITDRWFQNVARFENEVPCARVKENDKWYLINKDGNIISDGFDSIGGFSYGYFRVLKITGYNESKYNFINRYGDLLSEDWFDFVDHFGSNGYTLVSKNGVVYKLTPDGKLTGYSGREND